MTSSVLPGTDSSRHRTASRDLAVFVSALLRQPGKVGAVAPSSRSLARVLAAVVPSTGAPSVVELGAGTGAVSSAVAERLPSGSEHLAVELDVVLAEHLRRTRPRLTVLQGDAAELDTLLAGVGTTTVDAVVSGLPWSLFDESHQRQILRQVCGALAEGGGFSTFAYRHATGLGGARRFHALLHEHFDEVVVTRTIWRNLPPALAYICHRPISVGPIG